MKDTREANRRLAALKDSEDFLATQQWKRPVNIEWDEVRERDEMTKTLTSQFVPKFNKSVTSCLHQPKDAKRSASMTQLGIKSAPRYLNHLIKKKKKHADAPPSPKFHNRKEARLFDQATQEKKDSESFAHEIVPVRYLELKRKINLDHIE